MKETYPEEGAIQGDPESYVGKPRGRRRRVDTGKGGCGMFGLSEHCFKFGLLAALVLAACSTPGTQPGHSSEAVVATEPDAPVPPDRTPQKDEAASQYLFAAIGGIDGRAAILREEPGGMPKIEGACLIFGLELTEEDWKAIEPELRSTCIVVADSISLRSFGERYTETYNIEDGLDSDGVGEFEHGDILVRVKRFEDDKSTRTIATLNLGRTSILLGWQANEAHLLKSLESSPSISVGPFEGARPEREALGKLIYTAHRRQGAECGVPQRQDYRVGGPIWVSPTVDGVTRLRVDMLGRVQAESHPIVPNPDRRKRPRGQLCNPTRSGPYWLRDGDECSFDQPESIFYICG